MLLIMATLLAISIYAVPAKPGQVRTLTLADGTTVKAVLVGDEHGHYWLGENGKAYQGGDNGTFYEVAKSDVEQKAKARRNAANAQRAKRLAPRRVGEVGSYTGKKKGIIILVNFSDNTKFATANNQALYKRIANEENFSYGNFKGSMRDYFLSQSEGQFELDFDVAGPYTVSQSCSYYGANDSQGNDKYPAKMVIEALKKADADVNFADYDWDGDKEVEQVYVVYAGKGEADGGATTTIWPHEWTLSSAAYYGDGAGPQTLDGVRIDTYACGSELNGDGVICGIGTMCHEFSHCLGYPDFYDTDYSGGQGMGNWDLMDSGSYNGDGYQPAGYTSYERWVAGWKTPIELTATKAVTGMKALSDGGESYIIYNTGNSNEYYLLENRQFSGWDASLPGEGLLILHVDYSASAWSDNTPNDDPSHQRMTWIAADNKYQYVTSQGTKYYTFDGMTNDTYPYGTVNSFSASTTPAAKWINANNEGSYYMQQSVNNITQYSDGTIAFNFKGLSNVAKPVFSPAGGKYEDAQTVTISCDTEGAAIYYTIDGTTPTASSTLYTGPITVAETTTINAIAIAYGEESDMVSATYKIGISANTYKLVESISDLVSGKNYIIACGSKSTAAGSLTKSGNSSYLNKVDVEVDGEYITLEDESDVLVFTLTGSGSSWSMQNDANGYLYCTAAKKVAFSSSKPSTNWTLSNSTSGVIMAYTGGYWSNYGTMLYNSGSPRFTTYTSDPTSSMIYANLYMEVEVQQKQDVTMAFSATEATATMGSDFTAPTLTTNPEGLAVAWSSSNSDVATVDDEGNVTLVGAGTTTITATFAGNSSYNAASASYTLTVEESQQPVTVKGQYVLVNKTTQMQAGDEVIIVGNDNDTYYAISTTQNANNRSAVTVTMNDDGSISINDEVQVIKLEQDGSNWLFNVGGYLYAASSSKNYLRTETTADANAKAAITITDGTASIVFQGSNTRNVLQFNPNTANNSPLFSCYSTASQSPVAIYRKVTALLGDANGDGDVSLTDVTLTVNYVLNNGEVDGFVFVNADIDGDGEITVTDVMSIVDIILNK